MDEELLGHRNKDDMGFVVSMCVCAIPFLFFLFLHCSFPYWLPLRHKERGAIVQTT